MVLVVLREGETKEGGECKVVGDNRGGECKGCGREGVERGELGAKKCGDEDWELEMSGEGVIEGSN